MTIQKLAYGKSSNYLREDEDVQMERMIAIM